jgi:hypothetical protein
LVNVPTSVAKLATSTSGENASRLLISSV